jgi:hypothetical protein
MTSASPIISHLIALVWKQLKIDDRFARAILSVHAMRMPEASIQSFTNRLQRFQNKNRTPSMSSRGLQIDSEIYELFKNQNPCFGVFILSCFFQFLKCRRQVIRGDLIHVMPSRCLTVNLHISLR